jgi:peptidoglycan hydrolase CwlO-like protein
VHIVTKILVVLAAALSILLAALSVAYTANADRIRGEFLDLKAEAAVQSNLASTAAARFGQERDALQAQIAALQNEAQRLQEQVSPLQRERAQLLAQVKQLEVSREGFESKIDQLASTADTQAALITSYRDEVQLLRENELRYAQREIELADRINDLSGQLEVAQETNRALQEQLVEVRDQAGLSSPTVAGSAGAGAAGPIQARILNVRRDAGGNTLVAIDAGTNDRLRRGQELSIARGNEFVAKVILQEVNLNESIGRVDFLGRTSDVRPGDLVFASR